MYSHLGLLQPLTQILELLNVLHVLALCLGRLGRCGLQRVMQVGYQEISVCILPNGIYSPTRLSSLSRSRFHPDELCNSSSSCIRSSSSLALSRRLASLYLSMSARCAARSSDNLDNSATGRVQPIVVMYAERRLTLIFGPGLANGVLKVAKVFLIPGAFLFHVDVRATRLYGGLFEIRAFHLHAISRRTCGE